MDAILERARQLKQALTEFVLDAEDELAVALETFSAEHLSKSQLQQQNRLDAVVDRFLIEGKAEGKTPIELFLLHQKDLSTVDHQLLESWTKAFFGIFAITQIDDNALSLKNWTTDKDYLVKINHPEILQASKRLKVGEILLAQIAPVTDNYWIFFSPWTAYGKLGKPKLAVAIGNFKKDYPSYLYSDAPELLNEAWQSVEEYHQDFVNFFGSDQLTLSGYQLNKKIAEFQEFISQKRLQSAGIDSSKSLKELAQEAGMSDEDIKEAAEALGGDSNTVNQLFETKAKNKMVPPKVDLPAHLKNAEEVVVFSHPRWGQTFLPTYPQMKKILTTEDWQTIPHAEKLIHRYLEDAEINTFIWHELAKEYPDQIEQRLQVVLNRPEFSLKTDLDGLLQEFNKSKEPQLPEIASVPIHLHNLFQEAVLEVNKDKSKNKSKKKKTGLGFQS